MIRVQGKAQEENMKLTREEEKKDKITGSKWKWKYRESEREGMRREAWLQVFFLHSMRSPLSLSPYCRIKKNGKDFLTLF